MDRRLAAQITAGDEAALELLRQNLPEIGLHSSDIPRFWSAIINGIQQSDQTGDIERKQRLLEFALWFGGDVKQDNTVKCIYGDIVAIHILINQEFGREHMLFNVCNIAVGNTAYHVEKIAAEQTPGGELYLMHAKYALMMALDLGDSDCRLKAATALAHIPAPDVREKLAAIAQYGQDDGLREAAGESVAAIRNAIELNLAISDKENVVRSEYPDGVYDPRREMLDQVLDAVILVLGTDGEQGEDYSIAVKQVSSFANDPDLSAYFHTGRERKLLERMVRHAENALLHAILRANDPSDREEAGHGLRQIGSDRVEGILERMSNRTGEDSDVGRVVTETLETIRTGKCEIVEVKTPPKPPPRKPPRPPPRKKRTSSDPKKALGVSGFGPEKKPR